MLDQFSIDRKPEGDGLQDLSLHNFIVMRDKTADPGFLQKKIEQKVSKIAPQKNGCLFIVWLAFQISSIQQLGKLVRNKTNNGKNHETTSNRKKNG